ncbi:MAG: winged helix-turn-helix transcriptional regulator [Leptospira sp.]|nr:winged helix-turn-helix transcriptional regulator [Leptospira sp.]
MTKIQSAQNKINQLNDKEISIINLIYSSPELNQRELAKSAGISLGLVNIILKRLINKGLLKVGKINKRNLKYVLTPDGFAHTVYNTLKQINRNIKEVKNTQDKIFKSLQAIDFSQYQFVEIKGDNELSHMVKNLLLQIGLKEETINPAETPEPDLTITILCEPSADITNDISVIRLEKLIA